MCLSVADIIVVVVTWRQMRRQMKLFSTAVRRRYRPSYASVLLRDGTIYFLVLVPFNAVHLIFSLYSILGQSPRYPTSGIPIFTTPITAILISKFLVHLQEIESAAGTSSQSAWRTGLLVLQPSVGPRSREHSPEPSTSTPCRRDGTREGSLQGV
ncbi:hypothetical protein BD311DRAFT_748023 [Dichomitus squalens]|uniref:Uncharacterized protein n=1 Tax=Dichomitus squalens TaxID=114155 RepID=A0A4Q9N1V0_9APHY|nr:hypothetical protein BD311DRAFT_748023 [Dichomitus squalens]